MFTPNQTQNNNKITRSSITSAKITCKYDVNDFCKLHRAKGTMRLVTSNELKDRGGGLGIGIVKTKKEKFFCDPKKEVPTDLNIPTRRQNSVSLTNRLATQNLNVEGNNVNNKDNLHINIAGTSSNFGKRLEGLRIRFESESGPS